MAASFDPAALFATLQAADPFFVLAGPCVVENREHALFMARELKAISERVGVPFVYKSSFDKANRTSVASYRGPGMADGIQVLKEVKETTGLPIVTDIHESYQAPIVAEVADVLQIPAFLCRQTDLLVAAAKTGKIINIKKGQFASADVMEAAANKIRQSGNPRVMLCERGTTFGYGDLIVDPRNLVRMRSNDTMVVQDVTHSVQQPASLKDASGGLRHFIPTIARTAAAVGVNGFFFEVHNKPEEALSDGPNNWYLDEFEALLVELKAIAAATKGRTKTYRTDAKLW
eukprot:CAMPEP_0177671040 /NCGR_PEP_ID=MMETSP0447-20121125/24448_1 /TAXON_ID=0 /ORGANISM="Stygamoeba regulata, Strain BSH-02190019" /LENGTH=287 /DNA_ID=CAMNT_0019178319 /DNA_START=34 /DNA_END=897 /DNA_ORIENTATION=+